MSKVTKKRPQETEEELRELRAMEVRILAGKEKIVSGEQVMLEIMRDLTKQKSQHRRA